MTGTSLQLDAGVPAAMNQSGDGAMVQRGSVGVQQQQGWDAMAAVKKRQAATRY
jgi:hypothetical protein